MTKQIANMAAGVAVILAIVALILQIVLGAAGHHTLTLGAEIAWPVLVIIAVALFVWGRSLKA